jgi:hypothetical protein
MRRKGKYKGRLPGAKDKEPRIRRRPEEIATGVTIDEARKARKKNTTEKPTKSARKSRTKLSIKERLNAFVTQQKGREESRQIHEKFRALERQELTREELESDTGMKWSALGSASKKSQKESGKLELRIVKVVALIVRVNGEFRYKIQNGGNPEVAPCEEVIRRVTFEKEGSYAQSLLREAKVFSRAYIKYISRYLARE